MIRSESMSYHSILFSKDNSWEVLEEFGHLGIINIEDMNENMLINKRPFFEQIQEIDMSLEKLKELQDMMIEKELNYLKEKEDKSKTELILSKLKNDLKKVAQSEFYHDLFEDVKERHRIIKEGENDLKKIQEKVFQSSDGINVLKCLKQHLPENFSNLNPFSKNVFKSKSLIKLDYIIGVIKNLDLFKFQKSLFRLTRGNVFANYFTVKHNHFGSNMKNEEKTVVFLTFQVTDSEVLTQKIKSLCESLQMTIFPMPDSVEKIDEEIVNKKNENYELNQIFVKTENKLKENLFYFFTDGDFSQISRFYQTRVFLLKQKNIYETLNRFLIRNNYIEGRFWIPVSQESYFEDALSCLEKQKEFNGFRTTTLNYKTFNKNPPTLIKTNSFSAPFQSIVDTYGVPRYKEINPGFFTLVSFPFLFGVMFGDIGHGLLLFIFALFLYLKQDFFPSVLVEIRSLLILMGFFAFYCGFIYNDFFAIPFPLTNSCYSHNKGELQRQEECTYPLGLDFTWHHSANSISFINSFKMKLSIVLGVVHMMIGILMKGLNNIYFKDFSEFFFDFIPQLVFMACTFGYMVVCIFAKWLTDFSEIPSEAPSIISIFINFIGEVNQPLIGSPEFQTNLQQGLATISLCCIPLMLLGKPLIKGLFASKKNHYKKLDVTFDIDDMHEKSNLMEKDNLTLLNDSNEIINSHDEHDFGEMLIHQSIETIEFVLGSISNTASYLRLWALSLAHSQLAKVFFDMLLKPYISGNNSVFFDLIMVIIMFVFFLVVTFAVLMVMDLMECFLHALRLHWVEFQNKFYKGDGYQFVPFNFVNYISCNFN
jgi:V-type H+-transporting ATPase subunit a